MNESTINVGKILIDKKQYFKTMLDELREAKSRDDFYVGWKAYDRNTAAKLTTFKFNENDSDYYKNELTESVKFVQDYIEITLIRAIEKLNKQIAELKDYSDAEKSSLLTKTKHDGII